MKLWGGRFASATDEQVLKFSASLDTDLRFAKHDILGSMAYSRALAQCAILTTEEWQEIEQGLKQLWLRFDQYASSFSYQDEDIHLNIERVLSSIIGEIAQKLHTGRSRNDQVALDLVLYLREAVLTVMTVLLTLIATLVEVAVTHINTIIPGYTHLQQAQPIRFAHHLLAYAMMLLRDCTLLQNLWPGLNTMPLGSGALAGCGINLDRLQLSQWLGFTTLTLNSMDAVSNRDFVLDFLYANTMISMHLSRFCEDIILFASQEFNLITLEDQVSTGSSMMPQKKNPDVAELIRGKAGKLYSYLFDVLVTMKGLPLTYQKDLQETKVPMFQSIDTLTSCLAMTNLLLTHMIINDQTEKMNDENDYLFATSLANYLVSKGVAFRSAHHAVGQVVYFASANCLQLKDINLITYKGFHPCFDLDLYEVLKPEACIEQSQVMGGSNRQSVLDQITYVQNQLATLNDWVQEKSAFLSAIEREFGIESMIIISESTA